MILDTNMEIPVVSSLVVLIARGLNVLKHDFVKKHTKKAGYLHQSGDKRQ